MKTSEKIITYLASHGRVSGSGLVDYLGITDRGVRKQLKSLLDKGEIVKVGKPPKVYYSKAEPKSVKQYINTTTDYVDNAIKNHIETEFLYITPLGTVQEGWAGFEYWCHERKLKVDKTAEQYEVIRKRYSKYKNEDLIDGMAKLKSTFQDVNLDELFYIDFYSIELFGKTRLGQLLLFAKQSQNRNLMNEITDRIKPNIERMLKKYEIDGVGFIPPTVKRELQFMRQIENRLNLSIRTLTITKIKTPVAVPQKTLNKLEDRIINARETMNVDDTGTYNNILLIDDAVGSGATLNEVAKKIRDKGICRGKIIGLSVTGSFNGFEIISEV
jgi:hypothetical protein